MGFEMPMFITESCGLRAVTGMEFESMAFIDTGSIDVIGVCGPEVMQLIFLTVFDSPVDVTDSFDVRVEASIVVKGSDDSSDRKSPEVTEGLCPND